MTAEAVDVAEMPGFPWWLVLLEGIAALILGILFLTNTAMTTFVAVIFLGVWWLIGGIFALISIFVGDDETKWYWKLLKGIIGILAGLIVMQHPLFSSVLVLMVTVLLLGIMGIVYGAIGIYQAFKGAGWGPGILGVLSIIIGIYLLMHRFAATAVLPIVLGIFLIVGGVIAIWQSFQVKKLQEAAA